MYMKYFVFYVYCIMKLLSDSYSVYRMYKEGSCTENQEVPQVTFIKVICSNLYMYTCI